MADDDRPQNSPQRNPPESSNDLEREPFPFPEIKPLSPGARPQQRVDVTAIVVMAIAGIALMAVGWYAGAPPGAIGWGVVLLAALAVLGMKRKS